MIRETGTGRHNGQKYANVEFDTWEEWGYVSRAMDAANDRSHQLVLSTEDKALLVDALEEIIYGDEYFLDEETSMRAAGLLERLDPEVQP